MHETQVPVLPENLTVEQAIAVWKSAQAPAPVPMVQTAPTFEAGEFHGVMATRVRINKRPRH